MFPPQKRAGHHGDGFPRVRGDVPNVTLNTVACVGFSPRARGCSDWHVTVGGRSPVFPACAGMFLQTLTSANEDACFPRVRGDVPNRI